MAIPSLVRPVPRARGFIARQGNTLILALGVLALAAAMIAISSQSASQTLTETRNGRYQALAKAAVEAVLARREQAVIELAQGGDPQAFADWDTNYGLEFFGDCEVRWKVEPVRSVPKDRLGNYINFVTNPSADPNWPVPTNKTLPSSTTPAWRPNDTVYLFRVAADGRFLQDAGASASAKSEYLARAQGARYVAVFKEPLFRYVIFYAQQGPLGDLELSHGPAIKVMGNVHSNGSIYFGAGTEALNWSAVTPTNGDTQIGPQAWSAAATYKRGERAWVGTANYECLAATTTNPPPHADWLALTKDIRVRVTGVDGIFRLAKPAMYGFFNDFTMANPAGMPTVADNSHYVTTSLLSGNTLSQIEGSLSGAGTTDIQKMTLKGAVVNPYRVTEASKLITRPGDGTPDNKRRMNGGVLVGGWQTPDAGNDCRDEDRTNTLYWTKQSLKAPPTGFGGFVRTSLTGGRVKKLDDTLVQRPLEAQWLNYHTPALMGAAEKQAFAERGPDHQTALPGFLTPGTKAATSVYSDIAAGQIIEAPGYYVSRCLGGDFAMTRNMDATQGFISWTVTNKDGSAIPFAAIPEVAGIIVRERAVPDFTYFGSNTDPATVATNPYIQDKDITNPDYIPYAYGKHKDTIVWPFTEMWVSSGGTGFGPPITTGDDTFVALDNNHISTNKTYTSQQYSKDLANAGRLTITTIARSGGVGNTPTTTPANLSIPNTDLDGFFRDNWRFINLKRSLPQIKDPVGPKVDTTVSANFFDLKVFRSAQCRIMPDVAGAFFTGGNSGAKVALMVRPVNPLGTGSGTNTDLSTAGLNSRDPFAAITFSPVMGISTQRRLVRSEPKLISQFDNNVFYTGAGVDPLAPGTATPGALIVAATAPVDPIDATYGPAVLVTTDSNTLSHWRINQSSNYPGFSKSFSITTGEGLKVSPSFWFNHGPNVMSCQYHYQKYSNAYFSRPRLTDGKDGFEDFTLNGTQDADYQLGMTSNPRAVGWTDGWANLGRSLYLTPGNFTSYAVVPPTGTTRTIGIQTNQASSQPFGSTPLAVGFISGRGFMTPTTYRVPYPAERRWNYDGGWDQKWATVDTPVASTTAGNASSIWLGWSNYNTARDWFISIGKTEADLQAQLTAMGYTTFANAPAQDYPPDPVPTVPDTAVPAPSSVVTVTPSTKPPASGGPYRVAVLKQGSSNIRFETNSWISQRGTWFPAAVPNLVVMNPTVPEALNPLFTTNPGQSQSFRPDQYTGIVPPPVANWNTTTIPNSMNDPVSGSVTWYNNGTKPYQAGSYAPVAQLNNGGLPPAYGATNNPPLWEDAPVPRWLAGTTYIADANPTRGSVVWYNKQFWKCVAGHVAATAPSTASVQWQRADYVYLRIERDPTIGTNGALRFKYYIDSVAPLPEAVLPLTAADYWKWRTITGVMAPRRADGTPMDPNPALDPETQLVIPDAWLITGACPAVVGIAVQSSNYYDGLTSGGTTVASSSTNPVAVTLTNLEIREKVAGADVIHNGTEWESTTKANVSSSAILAGRLVDNQTSYLCSQYQVFWGPVDITEDFFSYTKTLSGIDTDRIAREQVFYNPRFFWSQSRWWNEGDLKPDYSGPQLRPTWVDKETGYSTTSAAAFNLASAPVPPVTDTPSPIYKSQQKELMAKTTVLNIDMQSFQDYLKNRNLVQAAYKWSTNSSQGVTSTATVGASWTGLLYVARTNRYPRNPNPAGANPWNPALPNSANAAGDTLDLFSGYGTTPTTAQQRIQARLVAANAADRGKLSAPIPWQDFHHGVMISNGADINWGYVSSAVTKFGKGKMTIASPSAVYVKGDLNNTTHNYVIQGATKAKYTPIAVMGDSVTLLSNSWNIDDYRITAAPVADGYLGVTSDARVTTLNTHALNRPKGAQVIDTGTTPPKTTAYRTCLLTNNQPTTKYRAFQDEGAPFINTMMFIEDWEKNSATMEFTGSLVVFDTCRYTRSYLLQDPRINGRSPFGLMGWNVDVKWAGITGDNVVVPDWCKVGASKLTALFDASANPNGSLPVYAPPNRNMSFNEDLLTEDGTPPETPFGVTAAGVAGWVRVVE